jgi:hypothetical protein
MEPRATYTGTSQAWKGAIKLGSRVVWTCEHRHHNRDQGGVTWGTAACGCARSVLAVALKSDADIERLKSDLINYNRGCMGSIPRPMWKLDYELSVRDEVRAALGYPT